MPENNEMLALDDRLAAWELWKQICCVTGCSPEMIEPGDRETDPARRKMIFSYLTKIVISGFKKIYEVLLWQKKADNSNINYLSYDDIVVQFDSAMAEFQRNFQPRNPDRPKVYKDYLWYRCSQSSDNPVAIIEGALTGARGNMRTFVRNYILHNQSKFEMFMRLADGEKKYYYSNLSSLDEPNDDDGSTPKDYYLSESQPFSAPDTLLRDEDIIQICTQLNRAQKVALLAKSQGVALNDNLVLQASGVGRDAVYAAMKSALALLEAEFTAWDRTTKKNAIAKLFEMIISELRTEKSAEPFLCFIEQVTNRKSQ